MKKSEKRRIGEARQAENLRVSIESGLRAQRQAQELAEKRKKAAERAAAVRKAKVASEAMRAGMEKASKAGQRLSESLKEMTEEDYPEVLDMTDETAFSA